MENKKDLKQVNNDIMTVQELENIIPDIITEFCSLHHIEDLKKESNNIFNACLIDISRKLIQPNRKTLITIQGGTNNKIDYNKLDSLLDIYIKLCLLYDSTVTILGFTNFTGLKYDTILGLQHKVTNEPQYNNITKKTYNAGETSKTGVEIYEKLLKYEEITTLECRKYNDLRIIARLNRITGGAYREYTQVDTAQRVEATPQEIADKYGGHTENTAFLPPSGDT